MNESGHHINVANLNLLMEKIKSIGDQYKPVKKELMLYNLEKLYEEGNSYVHKVADQYGIWKLKVDDREELFKTVKPIVTRIIGNLYGMDVKSSMIKDARQLQAKINSTRLTKPKEKDILTDLQKEDEKKHSVSQQSFNSVLNNFSTFLSLLENTTGYQTNETELTLENLRDFKKRLQIENQGMDTASTGLNNTRIIRDQFLYTPETGMVDIALSAKHYIRGIFGSSHPKYLEIRKINFRNFRR